MMPRQKKKKRGPLRKDLKLYLPVKFCLSAEFEEKRFLDCQCRCGVPVDNVIDLVGRISFKLPE